MCRLQRLASFARAPRRPVALAHLHKFTQDPSRPLLLDTNRFVHEQLPVRLAHAMLRVEAARATALGDGPHGEWVERLGQACDAFCRSVHGLSPSGPQFVDQAEARLAELGACLEVGRAADLQGWLRALATAHPDQYHSFQQAPPPPLAHPQASSPPLPYTRAPPRPLAYTWAPPPPLVYPQA